MSNKYWEHTLDELLGNFQEYVNMRSEDRASLAKDFAYSAEMEREANGSCNIPNPLEAEIKRVEDKHKKEIDELEFRERALRKYIIAPYNGNAVVRVSTDFGGSVSLERSR